MKYSQVADYLGVADYLVADSKVCDFCRAPVNRAVSAVYSAPFHFSNHPVSLTHVGQYFQEPIMLIQSFQIVKRCSQRLSSFHQGPMLTHPLSHGLTVHHQGIFDPIFVCFHALQGDSPEDVPMEPEHSSTRMSSKIVYAKVPPTFDGSDKAKWDSFNDALINYIWAYESEFGSEKKISFTLSLLGSIIEDVQS
ncbi:hypothetical protein MVEN_00009900 [Mycena venus]|uniref:Uncharacterized protein n=1 Tax=Mycena venus TaxID=2733690 RepID=A0A8H6Z5W3_9AGAR|nr:hypothetical protein MVEN_00009900 [Mycena venus]